MRPRGSSKYACTPGFMSVINDHYLQLIINLHVGAAIKFGKAITKPCTVYVI